MNADDFVGGHSILALERFMDDTRHMIIFDVLSWKSPVGEKGERLRLFLSDVGYAKAQASEKRGEIKIRKHAVVIEGHIPVSYTHLVDQHGDAGNDFQRFLGKTGFFHKALPFAAHGAALFPPL